MALYRWCIPWAHTTIPRGPGEQSPDDDGRKNLNDRAGPGAPAAEPGASLLVAAAAPGSDIWGNMVVSPTQ